MAGAVAFGQSRHASSGANIGILAGDGTYAAAVGFDGVLHDALMVMVGRRARQPFRLDGTFRRPTN